VPPTHGVRYPTSPLDRPVRVVLVVVVRGAVEVASWPLPGCDRPDLALVDDLARLQLAARRLGCSVRVRGPCRELLELLDLVGLGEVVTGDAGLGLEAGGEAEDSEQLGIDEAVIRDDPLA
jgi:hypothetical protein